MAAKLTRLTHKIAIPSGRGLYHLKFSLQAASPKTFGDTLVYSWPRLALDSATNWAQCPMTTNLSESHDSLSSTSIYYTFNRQVKINVSLEYTLHLPDIFHVICPNIFITFGWT